MLRGGFTLVETMVAMVMGTFALLALAGVLAATTRLQWNSLSQLELVTLGETKLDELRSFAALGTADTVQLSVGGSVSANVPDHFENMTSARGRQYTVRWAVAAGLNGTREVTVRVAPAARTGREMGMMDLRTLVMIE